MDDCRDVVLYGGFLCGQDSPRLPKREEIIWFPLTERNDVRKLADTQSEMLLANAVNQLNCGRFTLRRAMVSDDRW